MKKVLIINGPNINLLGLREPDIYGAQSYDDLLTFISRVALEAMMEVHCFQSNSEGAIVDEIQRAYRRFDGIVINPAAYTHTSVAIPDALKAVGIPAIEVHLSDLNTREEYRQISYTSEACHTTIMGKGFEGYREAIQILQTIMDKR